MQERSSLLIVDDDHTHLQVYGWIVEAAGYPALPAEVRFAGVDLPKNRPIWCFLTIVSVGKLRQTGRISWTSQTGAAGFSLRPLEGNPMPKQLSGGEIGTESSSIQRPSSSELSTVANRA